MRYKFHLISEFEWHGYERWAQPKEGVPVLVSDMWLVFETIADLAVDLAGVVVVEAAEGEAVVEQDAIVGNVGGGDGGREFFAEAFADGEIDAGVLGQVCVGVGGGGIGITVGEAGAVVDVGGGGDAPGEGGVEADVEGVALVVVDRGVVEADVALG